MGIRVNTAVKLKTKGVAKKLNIGDNSISRSLEEVLGGLLLHTGNSSYTPRNFTVEDVAGVRWYKTLSLSRPQVTKVFSTLEKMIIQNGETQPNGEKTLYQDFNRNGLWNIDARQQRQVSWPSVAKPIDYVGFYLSQIREFESSDDGEESFQGANCVLDFAIYRFDKNAYEIRLLDSEPAGLRFLDRLVGYILENDSLDWKKD